MSPPGGVLRFLFGRIGETRLPELGPIGEAVFEFHHQVEGPVPLERDVRRVEKHQRVPAPWDIDGVAHGSTAGHRVEGADGGLGAEATGDLGVDLGHVARHVVVVVVERFGGRIPAVVPHVEYDDIVAQAKELPERQIAVDGEPVAVAREDAGSGIRVTVTAHDDMRPVGHRQIDDFDRCRDLENAQRTILSAMLNLAARGGHSIPKRRPAAKRVRSPRTGNSH